MSSLIVQNLEPSVKARLRFRAGRKGHRQIFRLALAEEAAPGPNLAVSIHALFAPLIGVE